MGTIRRTRGAKEQTLFNKAINGLHLHKLKTAWLDVAKAFDSVNHEYLLSVLINFGIPNEITKFIEHAMRNWSIDLNHSGKYIGQARIEKGILQGDSLSPLLFVLCMEPISRLANNNNVPKIEINLTDKTFHLNHLLFMDDIKIFAYNDANLKKGLGTNHWQFTGNWVKN